MLQRGLIILGLLAVFAVVGCVTERVVVETVVVERVVEVDREVEVVVEKEVTREVEVTRVVTATTTVGRETPNDKQVEGRTAPTSLPRSKSILLVQEFYANTFSQLSTLGFSEGIQVKVVLGDDKWSNVTGKVPDDINLNISEFGGVIVDGQPTHELLEQIRRFARSGGNAVFMIKNCYSGKGEFTETLSEELQYSFEVSCARIDSDWNTRYAIRGSGAQFSPLWHGLTVGAQTKEAYSGSFGFVYFSAGPSSGFKCVAEVEHERGTFCTALQGKIGDGNVMFMVGDIHYQLIGDEYLYLRDHEKAALRLLDWLLDGSSP